MARGTKGGYYYYDRSPKYVCVVLYDFDARSWQLKPVHKSWLEQHVIVPSYSGDLSRVVLTGFATRKEFREWEFADQDDAQEYNDATATARAYSAYGYLNARAVRDIAVEDSEVRSTGPDEEAHGFNRSVMVEAFYY